MWEEPDPVNQSRSFLGIIFMVSNFILSDRTFHVPQYTDVTYMEGIKSSDPEQDVTEELTDDSGSSSDASSDCEYEDTDEFMSSSQTVLEAPDEELVPNSRTAFFCAM